MYLCTPRIMPVQNVHHGVDGNGAEFIGNKRTYSLIYRHSTESFPVRCRQLHLLTCLCAVINSASCAQRERTRVAGGNVSSRFEVSTNFRSGLTDTHGT